MSTIKRSMAVRPAPIGDDVCLICKAPADNDGRWKQPVQYGPYKWTGPWGYVITRVTNSTDYRPGWLLNKTQVDDLIVQGWTVSVRSRV